MAAFTLSFKKHLKILYKLQIDMVKAYIICTVLLLQKLKQMLFTTVILLNLRGWLLAPFKTFFRSSILLNSRIRVGIIVARSCSGPITFWLMIFTS